MRDVVKFREIIEGFSQKDDTFEVRCYLGDLREIISILNRLSAWEERGDTAETPQPNAKDAALAAAKQENERLRGKVEAYEPIVAAVESHLQRAMQILKGGKDE